MSIIMIHDIYEALRLSGMDNDKEISKFFEDAQSALSKSSDGETFREAMYASPSIQTMTDEQRDFMQHALSSVYMKHQDVVDGIWREGSFTAVREGYAFSDRFAGGGVFVGLAMGAVAGAAVLACIKYCEQLFSESD